MIKGIQFRHKGELFVLLAVTIQIFLLVVSLPANGYTIRESFQFQGQEKVSQNSGGSNILSSISSFLGWLFTIKQVGVVSADSVVGCCVTSNSCIPATSNSCSVGNYNSAPCDSLVPQCQKGTCVDKSSGTCTADTVKLACDSNGGTWNTKSISDVPECNQICCDIGGAYYLKSSVTCTAEGGHNSGDSVDQCGKGSQYGACVSNSDRSCKMKSEADCPEPDNTFYNGFLCTNPLLKTNCFPSSETQCGLGVDSADVYFKDTCGNQANPYNATYINKAATGTDGKSYSDYTYSGNKGKYWNYTVVGGSYTPPELSKLLCSPGKNCGICGYENGVGRCREFDSSATDASSLQFSSGDYYCASLQCNITKDPFFPASELNRTNNRANNQESWCVYEGHVGEANYSLGAYGAGKKIETTDPQGNTVTRIILNDSIGSYSGTQFYSSDPVGSYSGRHYCDQGVIKNDTGDLGQATSTEYRMNICGDLINTYGNPVAKNNWTVLATNRPNHGLSCLNVSLKQYILKDSDNSASVDLSQEAAIHDFNQQACEDFNAKDASGHAGKGGSDCRLQTINLTYPPQAGGVSANFLFDICAPKYPLGFDLDPNAKPSTAEQKIQVSSSICKAANMTCTTVWQKASIFGASRWFCIENCQCLTQNFANQANNLCVSLGDCGGYVNVAGQYTKNFQTTGGDTPGGLSVAVSYDNGDTSRVKDSEGRVYNLENGHGDQYNMTANGDINGSNIQKYKDNINVSKNPNNLSKNTPAFLTKQDLATLGIPLALIAKTGNLDWNANSLVIPLLVGVGIGTGALLIATGSILNTLLLIGTAGIAGGPVGWIITAAAVFAAIVIAIFSWTGLFGGETTTVPVEFTCLPWQPPTSSDDCSKCGSYGLPCTKYQCESLGSCDFINANSPNPKCVKRVTTPPLVEFSSLEMSPSSDYNAQKQTQSSGLQTGVRLKNTNNPSGCFIGGTALNFSLVTLDSNRNPEYSYCMWSYNHTASDWLTSNPGKKVSDASGLNTFLQSTYRSAYWNFSKTLPLTTQPDLLSGTFTGSDGKQKGNVSIFVSCESIGGQRSPVFPYIVNLCVDSNPDPFPASVTRFMPPSDSYITSTTTTLPMNFTLDKAAKCKWDFSDKDYKNMANTMKCISLYSGLQGFCNTTLTSLNPGVDNKIYIRCNTTTGVINPTSIIYTLKHSEGGLSIDNLGEDVKGASGITPLDVTGNTIKTLHVGGPTECADVSGTCFLSSSLNVTTSGGASGGGTSSCTYTINSPPKASSPGVTFNSDISSAKKNHGTPLFLDTSAKYYNITIDCSDNGGNKVKTYALFNFSVDTSGPIITRITNPEGGPRGTITVTTDEDARCYYNTTSCKMNLDSTNPNSMDSAGYHTDHNLIYTQGVIYYIRCKDVFDNLDSESRTSSRGCVSVSPGY